MDRLDTWLNAQPGWRRFGLLLVQTGPLFVLLAFCLYGLFGDSPPVGLALPGLIALGLVAAAAMGFPVLWFRARRDRDDRRKWVPLLTWRAMAYSPVMMGPFILFVLVGYASPAWHRQHQRALEFAFFTLVPCMFIVVIERIRYQNRLRDRRRYYVS